MKKIIFLFIMFWSVAAHAQDSLLFAGNRVIISHAGVRRAFPLSSLSYMPFSDSYRPTLGEKYQIKVEKEIIYVGILANLYIAGATTIAQKIEVLDSKIDNSVFQKVDQQATTPIFGGNTSTVTAITTAGNTISTTNCVRILVENQSLTTNASIVYGGQTIILGFKGSSDGYRNFYAFESVYDVASKKYSPFATMVINAASSNVFVTRIFTQ